MPRVRREREEAISWTSAPGTTTAPMESRHERGPGERPEDEVAERQAREDRGDDEPDATDGLLPRAQAPADAGRAPPGRQRQQDQVEEDVHPSGKTNLSKRRSSIGADQADEAFITSGTLKARTGAKIARSRKTRTQPSANIAMRFFCS